ncbi:flagellar type III secretion system pore protein FliP [Ectobacillus polymachus]|uniref:flagellar type III secretion system pore protein FliP n=1 Tax=Ectobacillus polymachus TaxID=1508806 RepID=UPI003A8A986B
MKKVSIFAFFLFFINQNITFAATDAPSIPGIPFNTGALGDLNNQSLSLTLLLLLTVLSVAPSIILLMTSFTRVAIVLSFVRTSLGTQQMPPNQVIIGLSLFLTFFIMGPTFQQINDQALQPYLKGSISQQEAYSKTTAPIKEFMAKQTRQKDLNLFLEYSHAGTYKTVQDIPLRALVPSFVMSELTTAFQMGFLLFIPFLVIDMIVASILMAMGMMMVPPSLISLPFKILLFILVDGWHLVVQSLFVSFT